MDLHELCTWTMPGHAQAISHFNFFDFAQTDTHTTHLHTHTNTLLLFAYLCFCVRFLPSQNIYKHRAQDFAVMMHLLCFSVRFQMQPLLLYFPSCCKPHGVSTIMTMIMARFYVLNLLPQKRSPPTCFAGGAFLCGLGAGRGPCSSCAS